MKKSMKILLSVVTIAAISAGVYTYKSHTKVEGVDEAEEVEKVNPVGPQFNADSAIAFCQAQCEFGPRTMNSTAHDKCGDWIIAKFKQFGCKVTCQNAELTGYDGTKLESTNVIASINPEAT